MAASVTVSPSISTRTPVSDGQRVVAPGGDRDLADRGGEDVTAQRPGRPGHLGQRRVVLDRHRQQGEPRDCRRSRRPWRRRWRSRPAGRQAAGDVGEQPAADTSATPGSATSAATLDRGRRPRSRSSRAPAGRPGASSSSPARTGTGGRAGRLRAAQATASASTSRSTRNFTGRRLLRVVTRVHRLRRPTAHGPAMTDPGARRPSVGIGRIRSSPGRAGPWWLDPIQIP